MQDKQTQERKSDNFYKGMVIASIIAAIALLALIVVTSLYLKRTTTYKAIISGGKKSDSAYTNKAFTMVSFYFYFLCNRVPYRSNIRILYYTLT